ncbi:DEAD/DEAH box helicase family protein [Anaerosphaera multitolerans]|uniref:Type III restriction endonuclease subunit R n=1 Tax=Anaerosphaera multitolerans TaxID=2487351 RepID=A0A437S8L3_9FIRM|nr:DEAD/DEAH box helicase family protein [Anaerosphaera multitolerans]RVU55435.1 type III restriction endonuclease subunit R [Anaerosphaera multitolerans]
MTDKFLYEELESIKKFGMLKDIPEIIAKGLSEHIVLREYQEEAFKYFITYAENERLIKNKKLHTLFHMATGSGKTVIMAGLILYLYIKGYRNFLFFVNQTNILEKTKENFTNPVSSKYLFANDLEYAGNKFNVREVDNFVGSSLNDDINICFTTTQKLHMDLNFPKENSLTYEDFEDNKIVFISDESHHINTMTKKPTKDEEEDKKSWEYSVTNAFSRNKDHVMLEFTATADLKDKNVTEKYRDKIIYNYPLFNFRLSGYTKDFQNFATDSKLWDRALMAIIMSEYRKYLYADAKINIKPVVMFKSNRIKDSENFYKEFFDRLDKLSPSEIKGLYSSNMQKLLEALDYFKEKDSSFILLVNSLKQGFSKDKSIIMNGAQDNTTEQQLQVNSLEDEDNPIRIIFTVDMLNEGWDVLNLFDIVRLYDTRQSGKGKVSSYTIKEAQLIGRGARYCPFQIDESQERFKRKYDYDLDNPNRILETMYYHSRNDSRYISELKQALIATGMEDENPIKRTYMLKESFKGTNLFQKGFVYANKRVPKGRENISGIEASLRNKTFTYTKRSLQGETVSLFADEEVKEISTTNSYNIKFKDISYNILNGASDSYNELKFSVLKEKYPRLKTKKEFLTSDEYLGNLRLEIKYYDEIKGKDIFEGLKKAFEAIASHVMNIKQEFEGTQKFEPKKISEVIKDKSVYFREIDQSGGKGSSQNNNPNMLYQIDLLKEDWYAYNDNYGTSEEKLAIKYFKTDIEPKLKAKGLNYYVIRNERVPELAIYSFEYGERFEPDFLIFIEKQNIDNSTHYQVYYEPKGDHLLLTDKWKEDFMLEIREKHSIKKTVINANDDYIILGLPFYNFNEGLDEIDEAIDKLIEEI